MSYIPRSKTDQGIQIVKKRLSHCGWPFLLQGNKRILVPPIRQTDMRMEHSSYHLPWFQRRQRETTFTQDMADIRNGKHAANHQIASPVAQGRVEEANHVKKQLPLQDPHGQSAQKEGSHRASPATTPSSRSTSTTWKKDSWSKPGPSSTKTRTPWAVSSPQKARLQAVRLHADGIQSGVCMTVSGRAR